LQIVAVGSGWTIGRIGARIGVFRKRSKGRVAMGTTRFDRLTEDDAVWIVGGSAERA
jgi:hypothetical protein